MKYIILAVLLVPAMVFWAGVGLLINAFLHAKAYDAVRQWAVICGLVLVGALIGAFGYFWIVLL